MDKREFAIPEYYRKEVRMINLIGVIFRLIYN